MSEQAGFDPLGALRSLVDGGVRFVLIGGVASRLHGSPSLTRDVDICHERDTANLERLVAVLQSVGARLRGVDEDLPFVLDAKTLGAGSNFTFTTELGDDLLRMKRAAGRAEDLKEVEIPEAIRDEVERGS